MGYRIAQTLEPREKVKPVKQADYLAFIRKLPCLVSRSQPAQAAHLSTANLAHGHAGRGKGQKASDRWALPLSQKWHDKQHSGNEIAFWRMQGIDPYECAKTLHGLYSERGDDAVSEATRLIITRELAGLCDAAAVSNRGGIAGRIRG